MKISNYEIWKTLKEIPLNKDYRYVSTWRLNLILQEKYPNNLITTDTLRNRLKLMCKKGEVMMLKESANSLLWKAT